MMKRLDFIDTAKGICMLLIMLGHCSMGDESLSIGVDYLPNHPVLTWIYSFHTTTFFIITGLLMEYIHEHERPMKRIILTSAQRLLIP